ncbi:fibronectin type III domain-containing protein [Agrilactobacillus fermenti]|uniref:fibronectin type III domain-containing protein n=1 Tax=Agrilactobacillus fermenti TaxID=2586909 RepID=UPI001E536732|nr:fibronectin type III domain-containing protein [Agrilactobacillus fermenti]MCD2256410.1 fibronectin type III domain-containing protein [Agrilactobacillus fermenti]
MPPSSPKITTTAGDTKVDFTFTAPDNDGVPSNGKNDLTGYNIWVKKASEAWTSKPAQSLANDKLSGTVDGLTNDTEYTIAVTAVNPVGESSKDAQGASAHVTPIAATTK